MLQSQHRRICDAIDKNVLALSIRLHERQNEDLSMINPLKNFQISHFFSHVIIWYK